jgi:hypothetical protein
MLLHERRLDVIKVVRYLVGVVLYGALAVGSVRTADASIVSYKVLLTTAFLGNTTPYFLDFQFAAGDSSEPNPNTVSVTSDTGQFAAFTLTAGLVPGSGENVVEFAPMNPTALKLDFTEFASAVTPDLLSIFICDGSFNCITTADPSGFDTVVSFIESTDPSNPGIALIQAYDTPSGDLNTAVSLLSVPSPEPVPLVLSMSAILSIAVFGRRRKSISNGH